MSTYTEVKEITMLYNGHNIANYLTHPDRLLNVVYAISLIVLGYFVAKRAGIFAERALKHRVSRHHSLLVRRALFYIIFAVFAVTGLQHLGFKLSILLGAAGVFTVAISFASQTAISNLISGIFLLFEHPFKVGDVVEVKGVTGVVDSIDLLSTKLKTSDNKLVRIPNESMIKSEITNLSYFSTRRIDIPIAVAYDCNIARLKEILLAVADNEEKVLKDPVPSVAINNFASGSIELKFMVWVKTKEVSLVRNHLQEMINQQLEKENIVMFPSYIIGQR
jgi:small-conductance mechanosensitive channel